MLLPKEIEWMKKRKWNKNYDKGGGKNYGSFSTHNSMTAKDLYAKDVTMEKS